MCWDAVYVFYVLQGGVFMTYLLSLLFQASRRAVQIRVSTVSLVSQRRAILTASKSRILAVT